MANRTLTQSVIAKLAVRILENELVAAGLVHRAYEDEFATSVNGYKKGATVSIRKPAQFTVRDGAVAVSQDVVEGQTSITVDKQRGVDFEFTSKDLTLSVTDMADRIIRPAMISLANDVDREVLALTKNVGNWVGTPGTAIASFAAMARASERFDLLGVPQERSAILSPTDHWGVAGSQTALYMQNTAEKAYRKGLIGDIAGLDTYKSANVRTHTFGPRGGTPLVNGGSQAVTYASVQDTAAVGGIQNLITDGWTAAAASRVKAGDVFTIAGVFAVNPVTKATQAYLQQFVVNSDVSSDASGNATLSITPAIVISGPFQTVSATAADNAALTFIGTASAGVAQNVAFHKNAFALCVVPMEKPEGAVRCARESYKGLTVRVIPFYDGVNDISKWRLDVLFGVKTLDERLACLIGG